MVIDGTIMYQEKGTEVGNNIPEIEQGLRTLTENPPSICYGVYRHHHCSQPLQMAIYVCPEWWVELHCVNYDTFVIVWMLNRTYGSLLVVGRAKPRTEWIRNLGDMRTRAPSEWRVVEREVPIIT